MHLLGSWTLNLLSSLCRPSSRDLNNVKSEHMTVAPPESLNLYQVQFYVMSLLWWLVLLIFSRIDAIALWSASNTWMLEFYLEPHPVLS